MKKEITPVCYFEDMTLEKDSWVVVDVTGESSKVYFYTPSQDKEGTPLEFREFAEIYLGNEFKYSINQDGASFSFSNDKASAVGSKVTSVEDVDEEYRKAITYDKAECQVVEVYKSVDITKINDLLKSAWEKLNEVEKEALEENHERKEFEKDPYGYYGVSKKNFM